MLDAVSWRLAEGIFIYSAQLGLPQSQTPSKVGDFVLLSINSFRII